MEGIKEAIEYVVGLSQPNYAEHEGMNSVAAYLKDAIQELHIEQDITFTVIS